MTVERALRATAVVLGGLAIVLGVVVGLVFSPRPEPGGPQLAGIVVIVLAVVTGTVKAVLAFLDTTDSPPPWTEAGSLVDIAPEETPDVDRVSGTGLRPLVDTAGKRARSARSVEAGLTVVRSPLREALATALVQAGRDPDEVEDALAAGTWTDDRVAAAVLDDHVTPPERSFARRLWAWLFPERAVRDRTARAVGAVAVATDEALQPVVGQDAARPVPVATPTIDDLRRTADGRLRRAESVGIGAGRDAPEADAVGGDGTDGEAAGRGGPDTDAVERGGSDTDAVGRDDPDLASLGRGGHETSPAAGSGDGDGRGGASATDDEWDHVHLERGDR